MVSFDLHFEIVSITLRIKSVVTIGLTNTVFWFGLLIGIFELQEYMQSGINVPLSIFTVLSLHITLSVPLFIIKESLSILTTIVSLQAAPD